MLWSRLSDVCVTVGTLKTSFAFEVKGDVNRRFYNDFKCGLGSDLALKKMSSLLYLM